VKINGIFVNFAIANAASIWRNQRSGSCFQKGGIFTLLMPKTGVFIFELLVVAFFANFTASRSRRDHQTVDIIAHN